MNNRTMVLGAILGGCVGLAIAIPVNVYILNPFFASTLHPSTPAKSGSAFSDDLVRDQQVADEVMKLDDRSKRAACEGYIGALKEQQLVISRIIKNVCVQG